MLDYLCSNITTALTFLGVISKNTTKIQEPTGNDTKMSENTKELKDSGVRQEFSTGAVRDAQTGKGRFDLIPFWPTLAYGCIMEAGALKYAANNWRKGMPLSRYIDSAQRHLEKYKAGFRDEPHLWQAFWNIGCAIHTQVQIYLGHYPKEFNDMYSDFHDTAEVPLFGEFETTRIDIYKEALPKK